MRWCWAAFVLSLHAAVCAAEATPDKAPADTDLNHVKRNDVPTAPAQAPEVSPERLARLLALLASADFQEREGARARLLELGEGARDALERFSQTTDNKDARARAESMLAGLDRDVIYKGLSETERRLAEVNNPFGGFAQAQGFLGQLPTGLDAYPVVFTIGDAMLCLEDRGIRYDGRPLKRVADGGALYKLGKTEVQIFANRCTVGGTEVPTNRGKRLVFVDKNGQVTRVVPVEREKKK